MPYDPNFVPTGLNTPRNEYYKGFNHTKIARKDESMREFAAPAVPAAPVNTVLPSLVGGVTVGTVMVCNKGTWTGSPTPTYTYQWKRNAINVTGTNSAYVLTIADLGATMTCVVTASNSEGAVDATTSNSVIVAAELLAPVNTVAPTVSGLSVVGSLLTSSTGTWTGNPTPTLSYQWKRGSTAISGEIASTYTTTNADIAELVTCEVTGSNTEGSVTVSTSNGITVGAAPTAPVNITAPVISGLTVAGSLLTSTTGVWSGDPVPTYAYQWKMDGIDIGGEVNSTYTSVAGDAGKTATCEVTGSNSEGSVAAISNGITVEGALTAPTNSVAPVVSGLSLYGSTLTSTSGTWAGNPAPTLTYQWQADGVNIAGAIASTFVTTLTELGKDVTCDVKGSNSEGVLTVSSSTSIIVDGGLDLGAVATTISFMGDSITNPQAAATAGSGYVDLFIAASSTATLSNRAVSGSMFQNGISDPSNGRDNFETWLLGANQTDWLYLEGDLNGSRYQVNPSAINPDALINDRREMLLKLIADGYDVSKIILATPIWMTDAGLGTIGAGDYQGQTRAQFEAYVDAELQIADEFSLWSVDVYAYMRDNGGDTLISGDDVHPTNGGHAAIHAANASTALRSVGTVVSSIVATPTVDVIAVTWTGAAASYTVGLWNTVTGLLSAVQTVATESVSFTAVPDGTYQVVILPVGGSWANSADVVVSAAPAAFYGVAANAEPWTDGAGAHAAHSDIAGGTRTTILATATKIPRISYDTTADPSPFTNGDSVMIIRTSSTAIQEVFRYSANLDLFDAGDATTVNLNQSFTYNSVSTRYVGLMDQSGGTTEGDSFDLIGFELVAAV